MYLCRYTLLHCLFLKAYVFLLAQPCDTTQRMPLENKIKRRLSKRPEADKRNKELLVRSNFPTQEKDKSKEMLDEEV